MPAKAQWLLRVPEILAELAALDVPVLDRAVCERLFRLRRRRTIDLKLCDAYAQWLLAVRGLAPTTIPNRRAEAKRFLESLGERGDRSSLSSITVADLDHYINCRALQVRRVTRQRLIICL